MKYPVWLKKGDCIGVTACSDGKPEEVEQIRMDSAKEQFLERGFFIPDRRAWYVSEKKRLIIVFSKCLTKTRRNEERLCRTRISPMF